MTYCAALKVSAGMVFVSDSRTNAGFDQISTFRKMIVYERPGDRFMVLLSSGNLSITQSVREMLQIEQLAGGRAEPTTIWNARSMFDAARVLGHTLRNVYEQDGPAMRAAGIDSGCTLIFGGQIKGEMMRLFLVYSTGNFIEATAETCYFQIGEAKYGKPILDRLLVPSTPLAEAAKCALLSMDSTLKSNLSVGLPIDMIVYTADTLSSDDLVCIDESNPYFSMIREIWGKSLREAVDSIENPDWAPSGAQHPLKVRSERYEVLRKVTSPGDRIV
ncbi:MAG TPA: proteasome-type protease [Polyangiaceae bacterium]|nr:proteasome-type protease [Polyangiaceae bacterium]